jgi:hypothetical protein
MARKIKRALRNGTGVRLSRDEVRMFAASPLYPLMLENARREMIKG